MIDIINVPFFLKFFATQNVIYFFSLSDPIHFEFKQMSFMLFQVKRMRKQFYFDVIFAIYNIFLTTFFVIIQQTLNENSYEQFRAWNLILQIHSSLYSWKKLFQTEIYDFWYLNTFRDQRSLKVTVIKTFMWHPTFNEIMNSGT